MVIAIYERVSSVKQDTAAQHGELAVWAQQQEAKGERIVWYTDKQSGKSMRRPGLLPPTPKEAGHLLLELDMEEVSDEAEEGDAAGA
jgi:hypothetical protein